MWNWFYLPSNNNNNNNNNNKDFIQEGNTISTKLISLAALKYLQMNNLQMNKEGLNDMTDVIRGHEISDIQANT